jgi:hypothetical protein
MPPHRASFRISAALVLGLVALAARAACQDAAGARPADDEALFLMLFGKAPPEDSPDDRLIVAEISVECPPSLDEAYVRSFARAIRIGEVLTARELDERLGRVQERMSLSNMFYTSSAAYERLEGEAGDDGPAAVRVLLRAGDGFWWGFNFWPWDLSIGYRNLGGRGKQLGATLGLNTQAVSYRDPSVSFGPLYWAAEAAHRITLSRGGVDPDYLSEGLSLAGELGMNLADDLSLGLALGCRAFRSPDDCFLYPDYAPPGASSLAGVGMTRRFSSLASAGLRVRLGEYGYQERGGIKAMASLGLDALASSAGGWEIAPRAEALGLARFDAPLLLRLTLRERITYIPETAGAGIPQALWATAAEMRCASGLVSGELSSVARVSLGLDRIAAIGLGFAELGIVPELFYEIGAVSRRSYGDEMRLQQDFGFLVKEAASMPVGRTFAFGVALGLEGESESAIKFVFEVE